MEITGVETFMVKVPAKRTYVPSWLGGDILPSHFKIVKVHTDEGITGVGETCDVRWIGRVPSEVDSYIPLLLGKDPMNNMQRIPSPALEMAVYDIVGKALKVPVSQLFGGCYRNKVSISYCMGIKTPNKAAEEAKEAVSKGWKLIKMKAGMDPREDVKRVRAVAEAVGPDAQIRVDANTGWKHPALAIKVARQIERYNIECLESPVPQWNLDWYKLLRQTLDTPIMLHLSSATEVINAVKMEACDYINISAKGMGLNHFRSAASIAEAAGIPIECGSGVDLGIADSASVQICAATKGVTLPSDLVGNFLHEDDLIVDPLMIEDGCIIPSKKSGLGIELDEDALKRYSLEK